MIKYKLTDQNMQTHNGFQWKLGEKRTIDTEGTELCSGDVFHFYDSPELAVLFNPIHANIHNPRLFEVECEEVSHDGLKGGSKYMTLVKELELPDITLEQKTAFAILCVLEVYKDGDFKKWAQMWLGGLDRTHAAAYAAADAAYVTYAAYAARAAAYADYATARAAHSAYSAAHAAYSAYSAYSAAYADAASAADAAAAAYATYAAHSATDVIDFQHIVEKALTYK